MNRLLVATAHMTAAAGLLGLSGCPRSTPVATESSDKIVLSAPIRDTWDAYLMQGKRIGYGHTTVRRETTGRRNLLRTDSLNHLAVKREGQTTEEDIRGMSIETPQGELIRFESEVCMGPNPIRTVGKIVRGRLTLETTGGGTKNSTQSTIPWPTGCLGPFAIEQSLMRQPMQPGERRTLKMLMIGLNQLADVELKAQKFEPTNLLNGAHDLLRIETVTRLADGQTIGGTVWTDRTGDTLKTSSEAMGLDTYRASKAETLDKADAAELDLLAGTMVKLDRPLPDVHQSKEMSYRIHLEQGDPASLFITGPNQTVKSVDAHTAEITIHAIRPGTPGNAAAASDPPTDDDLRPNSFIQSDDPTIVADAAKAVGDETDPWRMAVALERYVQREVKQKGYSQAFATAAEVAKTREGDCTEHAVFLAALGRARGIPSRVAIGLVYIPGVNAFGYHMWTEMYIGRRWIPMDGTLALGGIGAGHLEIAHTNLKGVSVYSAFLPVVQILGRLQITVVDRNR